MPIKFRTVLITALATMAIAASACSTRKTDSGTEIRQAIVIVPGFKGSRLVAEKGGEEVWLTLFEATFGQKSLELPVPGSPNQKLLQLKPDGIFAKVGFVPYLWSYEVYQTAVAAAEEASAGQAKVFTFSYDWRKDPVTAATALKRFVQNIRQQGYERVTLLAHSMGGLVGAYFLRYGDQPLDTAVENWEGAQLIDSAIFVAVPFRGAAVIFHDLQEGIQTGLNTSLLSAAALATMPAAYQLLPPEFSQTLVGDSNSAELPKLHDPSAWEVHRWGLFKQWPKQNFPAAERHTAEMLKQSAAFYELLHAPLRGTRPELPITNVAATGEPSLAQVYFDSDANLLAYSDEELPDEANTISLTADGDGTVPLSSALLPEAWTRLPGAKQIQIDSSHLDAFADDAVVAQVRESLR